MVFSVLFFRDNFLNLLDDKSFKNEIVVFSLDPETSVIQDEHRDGLLPVLMRLVQLTSLLKPLGICGREEQNLKAL